MSVAQAQRRNPEQVAILSADLQPRYEPNFAWKGICGLYQSLPALRGFWPCSSQIVTAQSLYLPDIANNYHCAAASVPVWGYDDLIPYVEFDGTDDYFSFTDNTQFDILGTETTVVAAQRGLTLGCWFKTDELPPDDWNSMINKGDPSGAGLNNWSYTLSLLDGHARVMISNAGTIAENTVDSTNSPTTTEWSLAIGRFVPSTSVDIFLDNTKTSKTTGVVASLYNSDAPLLIGAFSSPVMGFFNGKISMAFICAAALSDSIIGAIWQQTRAMYGR